MNFKSCLTGILLLSLKTFSQKIQPLTISDAIPTTEIKGIFNYPVLSSNLLAFNNRLVILDFMASNCISCLKALPRLDSLQKKYGSKIQIFLVTYEKKDKVKFFLQHHKELRLPVIGEDTTLSKYFPHTFISHEVWINKGAVKAITHADYVTKENIETVLSDAEINWPVKRDLDAFDYSRPLLQVAANVPADISKTFYSVFTPYVPGVLPRYTRDSNDNAARVSIINASILNLYLQSYNLLSLPQNHVILEVKDSSRFRNDGNQKTWKEKNVYCYESIVPVFTEAGERREKMRSDLDFYFGLHGRIEKRNMASFVIKRLFDNAGTKTGTRKISLTALLFLLNEHFPTPFINETGYTEKIILAVDENVFTDISALGAALKDYGLEMTSEVRETEVLVLTENHLPIIN